MTDETNKKPAPRRIWLQWYGEDDGSYIGHDRPEGVTFCEDRIYRSDICYVRAGKTASINAAEIEALRGRAEAAENRLAELEAAARWRPVGERPPNDAPVLALLESGEYKVARYVVIGDINGVPLHLWCGTGGSDKHVVCWQPIASRPGMI
jgi:hypothetical protein